MKISKSSWHYKYIASRWDCYPSSLCAYFWKIVLSIFLWMILALAVSFLGWHLLKALAFPIYQFWGEGDWEVSMSVWTLIGGFGLYVHRQWLYESGRIDRPAPSEPGLVRQYVGAAHRKICPLIEYFND